MPISYFLFLTLNLISPVAQIRNRGLLMPMNLCVAFKTNVIYYWVSGVRIRCLKIEQKACFESFVLKLVKRNGEVVSGPVVQLVRALS